MKYRPVKKEIKVVVVVVVVVVVLVVVVVAGESILVQVFLAFLVVVNLP